MTGRAPALLSRAADEGVAVRLVHLDVAASQVDAARSRLTAAELRYADRGTPAVRDRRVLLRAALRELTAELLRLGPAEVPLSAPPGRPTLTGEPAGRLDLGCSASGRLGIVAAAAHGRLGVDIEVVTPDADPSTEDWLTAGERAELTGLPAASRPTALARCWTQKEAVLKGIGTGLRSDPAAIDTTRPGDWELRPLVVPAGWVATLAVRRDGCTRPPADRSRTR